jgi:hypothetical protein
MIRRFRVSHGQSEGIGQWPCEEASMQDTALYQYLLGLKSQTVSRINLNSIGSVWMCEPSIWRTWRGCALALPRRCRCAITPRSDPGLHRDSCLIETHLRVCIPRVACDEHAVIQLCCCGQGSGRGSRCGSSARNRRQWYQEGLSDHWYEAWG